MPERMTRAALLEGALLAGGAVVVGGVMLGGLPDFAASKPSPEQDAEILSFALLLEHMQAGCYSEVERIGALKGALAEQRARSPRTSARNAAWIRRPAGVAPAAAACDEPRSKASTLKIVAATDFTVQMGATGRPPRFTG